MHEAGTDCMTPGACEKQECFFRENCDKEFWQILTQKDITARAEGENISFYGKNKPLASLGRKSVFRTTEAPRVMPICTINPITGINVREPGEVPAELLAILQSRNLAEWTIKIQTQCMNNEIMTAAFF